MAKKKQIELTIEEKLQVALPKEENNHIKYLVIGVGVIEILWQVYCW